MKLRKILTPVLSAVGVASVATPLVCLTSCSGDKIQINEYFELNISESSNKVLEIERTHKSEFVAFELTYIFDAQAKFKALPETERKVTPTVVFHKRYPEKESDVDYSYINISQCYGSYDDTTSKATVKVVVSVLQSYWERTKLDEGEEPKSTYSIQLADNNWYADYTGFSIALEKPGE